MNRILLYLLFFTFLIGANFSSAQQANGQLPVVFQIGEHEPQYEQLLSDNTEMLLSVCDYDMKKAFLSWNELLIEMENYSKDIAFDLRGTKFWVNIFFSPEGKINHIAYYLKPKSRNINKAELSAFLKSFAKRYQISVSHDKLFYHAGQASFPLLSQVKPLQN